MESGREGHSGLEMRTSAFTLQEMGSSWRVLRRKQDVLS